MRPKTRFQHGENLFGVFTNRWVDGGMIKCAREEIGDLIALALLPPEHCNSREGFQSNPGGGDVLCHCQRFVKNFFGLVFLLAWATKWPQYTLIVLAPFSMAAAQGALTIWDLVRRLASGHTRRVA